MKEATGELNMTVVTVIAIAAIAGLFYAFVWPMIESGIKNNTCATFGEGDTYSSTSGTNCVSSGDGYCCASTGS